MATMAFDTYRAVKDLEEVGFDETTAHVMVSVVGRAIGEGTVTKADITDMATRSDLAELRSEMATKSDLLELRAEMATKSDMAQFKSETRAEIKDSEARLTTRFIWIGLAIVGLSSAIMGALDQILG